MVKTKIPTPEECLHFRNTTLEVDAIPVREYINETLRKNGGGFYCAFDKFPTGKAFSIWEIIRHLKKEFHSAGWNMEIVSDQRDGDYFSIKAISAPRQGSYYT